MDVPESSNNLQDGRCFAPAAAAATLAASRSSTGFLPGMEFGKSIL